MKASKQAKNHEKNIAKKMKFLERCAHGLQQKLK